MSRPVRRTDVHSCQNTGSALRHRRVCIPFGSTVTAAVSIRRANGAAEPDVWTVSKCARQQQRDDDQAASACDIG